MGPDADFGLPKARLMRSESLFGLLQAALAISGRICSASTSNFLRAIHRFDSANRVVRGHRHHLTAMSDGL
jgi:hypothetical protein